MAPIACRETDHDALTREGITSVISYRPVSQRTYWNDARICLGENPSETYKHFDLCYSFKMLCWAEYGNTRELHLVTKNYVHNYSISASQHQSQQIPYERALRNLTVLMFSHYINHLENTGALEGHQTLMVHECLTVASALGQFHQWQRWVDPEDHDKLDWDKVPVMAAGDFRHKYSSVLVLLGNPQHPAYVHLKLLGWCYDNVYHQGRFIGDLPAQGKPPTKEQTQKIYNQEYEEVVAQIKNTLKLSDESPSYLMVPTSLLNLDIVLPTKLYRAQHGLAEPPPSCMPEPREYNLDSTWGLVDLSWTQRAPQIQLDDIDRDPRYSQYPYQEADEYKDDEEDMEVDERVPGNAGGTCMAAPTSTQHPYHHPKATYSYSTADQTPGSPCSIHTNTDAAMEMGGLSVSSGRPDSRKVITWMEVPCESTRMLSTPDLVTSITKGMTAVATKILERFAHLPPVDNATAATIRECFQQWRATVSQPVLMGTEASGHQSAFDRLGHWVQSPWKDDQWVPRPKMTPKKVERGCQQNQDQEPPHSTSQKRHSQSRSQDQVHSKKSHTEGDGRRAKYKSGLTGLIQVFRNPFPNQTHSTHLLNQTHVGQVMIHHPG